MTEVKSICALGLKFGLAFTAKMSLTPQSVPSPTAAVDRTRCVAQTEFI